MPFGLPYSSKYIVCKSETRRMPALSRGVSWYRPSSASVGLGVPTICVPSEPLVPQPHAQVRARSRLPTSDCDGARSPLERADTGHNRERTTNGATEAWRAERRCTRTILKQQLTRNDSCVCCCSSEPCTAAHTLQRTRCQYAMPMKLLDYETGSGMQHVHSS